MKGPKECQNYDGDFAASERQFKDQSRKFSKHLLFRKHLSGDEIAREWIVYSPSTGSIFCFICVLFGDKHITTPFSGTGFSDWKHASSRLIDHENSVAHPSAQVAYSSQRQVCGRIQLEAEKRYWHDILKRVVAVIKIFFQNLVCSFEEIMKSLTHHTMESTSVYLSCMMSKFDPFLRNHIETYGNKGKGRPSYLSSTICEEFIEIMGSTVLSVIITELKEAKYFSLSGC